MNQIFIICLSLIAFATNANNVQLNNISVINNTNGTGKVIQFSVSWENSWRTASTNNYDGIWVFFKFKDTDGKYYPLYFTGTDITLPSSLTYQIGNTGPVKGVGMFIYRNSLGSGTVNAVGVRAGISSFPGVYEVNGYAIEMVYIPQGSFYVGDSTDPAITNTYKTGTTRSPYLVAGNGSAVTFGTAPGNLNDTLILNNFSGNAPGFPTGYESFWMMKYELSQGAYRDFLNTLTFQQQVTRFAPLPTAAAGTNLKLVGDNFRQGIEIITPASALGNTVPAVVGCDIDNDNIYNETTDGEWIPVGFINWGDAAAYLDWAGLRPMTELEYEKACRGPLPAVASEFAWGAATYNSVSLTLSNPGLATETITNPSSFVGNLIMNTSFGPARGGIFANAFSSRISSGAGYYGIMELSGNLWEFCVQTLSLAGRSFNGKNGDGILTSVGNANENFWPGINGSLNSAASSGFYDGGSGVRSTAGISVKGGSFYLVNLNAVSKRSAYNSPSLITNNDKENTYGIRGVRDEN